MSNQIYIPQDHLTHEIRPGQVYGNARTKEVDDDGAIIDYEEKFRLLYEDDERVLLRSNKYIERGEGTQNHHYRCEHRDVFEANAAEGFYALLEDPDDAPAMPTDGLAAAMTVVKRHRDRLKHTVSMGAGRKDKHKLEALVELIGDLETMNPTEIDWETVDGVGAKTAENLQAAGICTDADVLATSDEALLAIDGVGAKNLQNIKARSESE